MKNQGKIVFLLFLLTSFSCTNSNSSSLSSSLNSSSPSSVVSESSLDESSLESENSSLSSSESLSSSDSESSSFIDENYLERDEILTNLGSSPFKDDMKEKENMGLSNIKEVGVDKEKFENEELYPCPNEGHIYLAEDYNITPTGQNNSGNLSILLANITDVEGIKIVKFNGDVYKFTSTVDVTGIKDLYLVGEEGTQFIYSGWGTYFEAKVSSNIHLNNITFDMENSPTIGGVVKRVERVDSNPVVYLDIPEEFHLEREIYKNYQKKTCSYMECYFDNNTQRYVPDRNKNLFYNSPTSASSRGVLDMNYDEIKRELALTLNANFPYRTTEYKDPEVGTHVSFAYTMYENHGFHFVKCDDVYFENVLVHVTGGMGMRIENGKNVYLNRTNFAVKEGSSRIMTCTADIIHTIALEGNLNITNCLLESSHDDALNIKSFYTRVTSVNASSKEIDIAQTQNEVAIPFEKGDKIDVYEPTTMGLIDSFTIVDIAKIGTSYTLTVDKRPSKVTVGLNVGNATRVTKLKLNNCIIRNKRNRGILLQSRESEIVNCTFENVVMGAIQVLAVNDIFKEAIVPQDIVIANNKFINNYNDLSVFAYGDNTSKCVSGTIQNVDIYNNYFTNGYGTNIWALANKNTKIHNNLFHYTTKRTSLIMSVETSEEINIYNNVLLAINNDAFELIQFANCSGQIEQDNEKKEID